ncbi:hypothetical protein Cri9333_4940 (plasmid) [Crinalium epipsammum PCC 9333]|uniref:Uncharacterized protein n=1 Tax=Crinalium epipsammum PCC 9333 TaxID=1173022 RepID=K9W694_9CYAN|nr:hypothetical protein [Crinalium epipsammum]AFZ15696.1 hypothetical protein Cri9333_4940 [Crinalium epipsammum PCC 9333]
MGQAKRRKQFEPDYGKPKIITGSFISVSDFSDAHAIYLGINRFGEIETRLVSAHACIKSAWEKLGYCRDVLSTIKFTSWQTNNEINTIFLQNLVNLYGDYESDDAIYMLDNDVIKTISPPVKKLYTVSLAKRPEFDVDYRTFYGNPDDYCFFTVIDESGKPISIFGDKEIHIFSSYVTAAYVADYCHENKTHQLSPSLFKQLWTESNKIQGKI